MEREVVGVAGVMDAIEGKEEVDECEVECQGYQAGKDEDLLLLDWGCE